MLFAGAARRADARADRLLDRAESIFASLGQESLRLATVEQRGRLAWRRGDHAHALLHFGRVLDQIELTYLSLADPEAVAAYSRQNQPISISAIECGLAGQQWDGALLICERAKARRFLLDVILATPSNGGGTAADQVVGQERTLSATIRPLRNRLLTQAALSVAEREALQASVAVDEREVLVDFYVEPSSTLVFCVEPRSHTTRVLRAPIGEAELAAARPSAGARHLRGRRPRLRDPHHQHLLRRCGLFRRASGRDLPRTAPEALEQSYGVAR
jgi:hypothetical protein